MAFFGLMKKNAIVTVTIGPLHEQLAKLTHPTLKAYADRLDADFVIIDQADSLTPHWAKFQLYGLLTRYRRIIYLDTDLIVRDDTPDLFKLVPEPYMGLFNEGPFVGGRQQSMIEACKDYGVVLPNWNGAYYNTGVMVISRGHRQVFCPPPKEGFNFYEQGYLNMVISRDTVWVHPLEYRYNRMCCMDSLTGEDRHASYIVHYAGFPNPAVVNGIIQADLEVWAATKAKGYHFKRHILIDVQGGLGDQICAEPAIRFAIKHVWPGDDVQIKTHFPWVFSLLGVPVFHHNDWRAQGDVPWHVRCTLPGPNTPTWGIVSNLLCHTVDYAAIALLRRLLPVKDKVLQLPPPTLGTAAAIAEHVGPGLQPDLVLVHAGRHWESKTFPKAWWQEVVDALYAVGLRVCLIGRNEDNRGVWDLEIRDGMIDTVDMLSLQELATLISAAGVLVSNDSSPVHIAGAYDNWVVLIPSCKHPDHLLPYRDGGVQRYKTKALYRRLVVDTFETSPTCIHGSSGEFVVDGEFEDYLPTAGEIAACVSEIVKCKINHD